VAPERDGRGGTTAMVFRQDSEREARAFLSASYAIAKKKRRRRERGFSRARDFPNGNSRRTLSLARDPGISIQLRGGFGRPFFRQGGANST
jgi:hypothetical protein